MQVLVVDDESLARSRMRALLAECGQIGPVRVTEASTSKQALDELARQPIDVILLDIHMPGMDGLALAAAVGRLSRPPAVVFVTAHAEHALQAFELEAVDYLTKPVRAERLRLALDKAARWLRARAEPAAVDEFLLIHDRGRAERVPLDDVVYLKAELKYVTVRTPQRSWLYDGSLHELERDHPSRWLRVHRNALVARNRLRALERGQEGAGDEGDGWVVRLDGIEERLQVSRRQLPAVREALART
jgi:two-component system response regulator AlgR